MLTLGPDALSDVLPHLSETLEREHEIVLVVAGEPVAHILPMEAAPKLESLAAFCASLGRTLPDSTPLIREDRDRRGT